jgi:hypothetical protein
MMKRLMVVFLMFSTVGSLQAAGVITAVDENGMPDAELVDIVADLEEQRQREEFASDSVPLGEKFLADVGGPKPDPVPSIPEWKLQAKKQDPDALSDDVPNL